MWTNGDKCWAKQIVPNSIKWEQIKTEWKRQQTNRRLLSIGATQVANQVGPRMENNTLIIKSDRTLPRWCEFNSGALDGTLDFNQFSFSNYNGDMATSKTKTWRPEDDLSASLAWPGWLGPTKFITKLINSPRSRLSFCVLLGAGWVVNKPFQ